MVRDDGKRLRQRGYGKRLQTDIIRKKQSEIIRKDQERIPPVHGPQQPSLPEYYESGRTAGGRLSAAAEWKRAVCAFDGDSVP